jgi:mannosyltransferase OCH1-like enzyme
MIPRHIHQIWIGPNPCPEVWIRTVRAFCASHRYNYTLWTEQSINTTLSFDTIPGFRDAYGRQHSLPGRADLLRYLILWIHGGLYLDADVVIANPRRFHAFLQKQRTALFFAWEDFSETGLRMNAELPLYELDLKGRSRLIANSVIGSSPRHPFLRAAIEGADEYSAKFAGQGAWREVGPAYITNLYDRMTSQEREGIMIYPMEYFYPVRWGGITDPEYHLKHPLPASAMLFQYGYSTNKYDEIFKTLGAKSHIRGTLRARSHLRRRQTRKSLGVAPQASLEPHSLGGSSGNADNSGYQDA